MPLVTINLIENVFSAEEKAEMITRITDTMVAIEGENMRQVTWVKIEEVPEGQWGIGGTALTAAMVHQLQKGKAA
jgi:4-oxalocrotonate tautomerase